MGNLRRIAQVCRFLQHDRVLGRLTVLARAQGVRLYVVGGWIRDTLRGVPVCAGREWDFAVDRGAVKFARAAADVLGAAFVPLDVRQGVARVVCARARERWQFDFADLRAATLKEDLRRRDFSINTLCVHVSARGTTGRSDTTFFDYWAGMEDLRQKRIRVIRPRNLTDDPLRVLRGFALCGRLGFHFDPETAALLPRAGRRLDRVAAERITEELAALFGCGRSFAAVRDMAQAGILERLFPELSRLRGLDQGGFHHLDAWQHSLETVRQFELIRRRCDHYAGSRAGQRIRRLLDTDICPGRPHAWIVVLACLLHDVAKSLTRIQGNDGRIHFYTHDIQGARIGRQIGRRLKLSGKETDLLGRLINHHIRPGQLVNRRPSRRAIFRFFRDMGEDVIPLVLLTIADRRAMRGRLSRSLVFHEEILWRIVRRQAVSPYPQAPARLLNGNDVMKITGNPPGPQVGCLLKALDEAQALGHVRTVKEARVWIKQRASSEGEGPCAVSP